MRQKKVHLDVLRVIAIWGVLFTHTGDYGMYHYLHTENPINFWFGFFFAAITQYCVPLFFMISGALLLKKEESIGYVFKHRVLRIFLVIMVLSFIQFLSNYFHNPEFGFVISRFFQTMYEGALQPQYWFLFEYLSFLLVLPFLQKMVKSIQDKSWYIYVFFLFLIVNCICPILTAQLEWSGVSIDVRAFVGCIFYSVMGHFVENVSEDMFYKGKNVFILFLMTAVMVGVTLRLNYVSLDYSPLGEYSRYFAAYYAFFIFVLVRYLCSKCNLPVWVRKVFSFAGEGVFGTYLMEQALRDYFMPIYITLNTRIRSYPATFVWLFVCLTVGVVITNIVKRIPIIGKLL